MKFYSATIIALLAVVGDPDTSCAAETQDSYFGREAVIDRSGVIAPWHEGQNGQFDFRVRVAAESMKRFPWTTTEEAVAAVPEYLLSMVWQVDDEGVITVPPLAELLGGIHAEDWVNGDRVQMAATVLNALVRYYRYSGDPAALAQINVAINAILDYCVTNADHPWPAMVISVPTSGQYYGSCDEDGWIQLDHVAEFGVPLLQAYQITGNERWFDAAKRWGDLFAQKRNREPGAAPWNRYGNPQVVSVYNRKHYSDAFQAAVAPPQGADSAMTGGVTQVLMFLDELIRLGYTGTNGSDIVAARDAGREYLRDSLLPRWAVVDTWGRSYWDWTHVDQGVNVTFWVAQYLMAHPEYFTNWRNDVRNILSLYLNRASANELSEGEVYNGAWALPEGAGCCGKSLSAALPCLSQAFAQYALLADSEWAKEIARRGLILGTYDMREDGVGEDNIDGGKIVYETWFKITHPNMMFWTLETMSWLPEMLGPARENHIMRSSATVTSVIYGRGHISYSTFDAPENSVDVLRLSFEPLSIEADGISLAKRSDKSANGFTVKALETGDFIVTIRHDGLRNVVVKGNDPQSVTEASRFEYEGSWSQQRKGKSLGGEIHLSAEAGASAEYAFTGNQVRILGSVGPEGGLADVYLDGEKQLVGIDFWNPRELHQQIVYYKNGLSNGKHSLRIVVRGETNPVSVGNQVFLDGIQYSNAVAYNGFGEGGGPTNTQRMIFGYVGRTDYVDVDGNAWKPASEFVALTGRRTDVVAKTWWTMPQGIVVVGTPDQELYKYGVHWPEFVANVTVGPSPSAEGYYARLKFSENQYGSAGQRGISIFINDEMVVDAFDVYATAGSGNMAIDLIYNNIEPKNGVIELRFRGVSIGGHQTEAMIQAIEVGPGHGGSGAVPETITNLSAAK